MRGKEALKHIIENDFNMIITTYPPKPAYNGLTKEDMIALIEKDLNKLGQLEDIEEKLEIDLLTLFKALENGFYYTKNDEIHFCRWCVRVGNYLVETKPCYAVKETTLQSCYYGDVSELKQTKDAHYWDWDTSLHVELKDYGKTWALTMKELEDE